MPGNSDTLTYLITGANRGIGLGLVQQLSTRPNTIILATTRNPSKPSDLKTLAEKNSNIHILKLEATSDSDHKALADEIRRLNPGGSPGVDVIIANAGIISEKDNGAVADVPIDAFRETYDVNVFGPLRAWHHLGPLLKEKKTKKFLVISSILGSIQNGVAMSPTPAYNSSKAAVNALVHKIAEEHKKEGIIAIPIHPGWVATDMGNSGGRNAPVQVPDSAKGILKVVDEVTLEGSGAFRAWDGSTLPW